MKRVEIFNSLFESGMDYKTYRLRSDNHSERMDRAYKAVSNYIRNLKRDDQHRLNKPIKILIIGENWCGDCAKAIPSIAFVAELFDEWQLHISPKDDISNPEIVDEFTTSGKFKIPVVLFADQEGNEILRWVERPTISYRIIGHLKNQHLSKDEFIEAYKETPELQTENVAIEVAREILWHADRAISLLQSLN